MTGTRLGRILCVRVPYGLMLPEHSTMDEEPTGVKCANTLMQLTASQHRTKALPSSVISSSTEWT